MISNFLFHRVNPVRDELWDPVDVPLFEQCIDYITDNFDVRLIEDVVDDPMMFEDANVATISFDDGYKDNITYAAPILRKYEVRASFYVVTDSIEHNVLTWTHVLEYVFQNTAISRIDMNFDFLPETLKADDLPTKQDRIAYIKKLNPAIRRMSYDERWTILRRIEEKLTDVEFPKLMMNWQDLRDLKEQGHYIGSHTVSHRMLGYMMDDEAVTFELAESARMIRERLGHTPRTLAYPLGSHNPRTMELCQEIGYKAAMAVGQEPYSPRQQGIYQIPRIEIYNEPWFKTRMRITNSLEKLKELLLYK